MDRNELTSFYDKLKNDLADKPAGPPLNDVGGRPDGMGFSHQGAIEWRRKAHAEADKLKDACNRKILIDVYCKVLPMDQDYVDDNRDVIATDIDNMLAKKDMTATQYLKSSYVQGKQPLVEFMLRTSDYVGKVFLEKKEEELKDAQKNDMSIPDPVADTSDENVDSQIIDVQKDSEFDSFIDKLKEKTANKIVSDISKVISGKKEDSDMKFDLKPDATTESVISLGNDYITQRIMKEHIEITPEIDERIMGLCIRESTLNIMDSTFRMPKSDIQDIGLSIRLGKGCVVTESAVLALVEEVEQNDESRKKEEVKKTIKDEVDRKFKASDLINVDKAVEEDKDDKNKK